MALERGLGIGIFDPQLGGDPLLFQHLFRFYSHPAVYIMVLPAMGVVSELVTAFSHNRIFGYAFVAFASIAIAVIGFLVWGHHMFTSGQSMYAGLVFSFLSYAVAVPSAIKVYNWTATLYQGQVELKAPLLYALGFIALFVVGGTTGLEDPTIREADHRMDHIQSHVALPAAVQHIERLPGIAAGDMRYERRGQPIEVGR